MSKCPNMYQLDISRSRSSSLYSIEDLMHAAQPTGSSIMLCQQYGSCHYMLPKLRSCHICLLQRGYADTNLSYLLTAVDIETFISYAWELMQISAKKHI